MASAINFKFLIMIKIIMLQNYAYILNYQKSGFTNSTLFITFACNKGTLNENKDR